MQWVLRSSIHQIDGEFVWAGGACVHVKIEVLVQGRANWFIQVWSNR